MIKVMVAFLLVSMMGFGADTAMPAKIRGILMLSPIELQGLSMNVSMDHKCVALERWKFSAVSCELSNSIAIFETKTESKKVVLNKLLEMKYSEVEPGTLLRSYTLQGHWEGSLNGYQVSSSVIIELYEFNGKPDRYSGTLQFQDFPTYKIPLDARAE